MSATHAVVIGGSMAGICAARVLADFYDRVTVLDRDIYPTDVAHRRGVPQSHHAHALLARGQQELEALFPGFAEELVRRGALCFDFNLGFAVFRKWGWSPRASMGLDTLWSSRVLLESVARAQLRKAPNVELREGVVVEDLVVERNGRARAAGVLARDAAGTLTPIAADLVVDASGRGTKAPSWLEAAGLPRPVEDTVDAHAGYASRFYRRPPASARPADWWWDGLWIEMVPPEFPRGGVAFPIEDDRWLVTLVGFAKDFPPQDEAGFLEFADSLYSPILRKALATSTPESDIVINRSLTNRFRRYEKQSDSLDQFIAVGDSVCAFNPVYGQGMSAAAASAAILRDALKAHGPDGRTFPRAFFRDQAKFLAAVWSISTGADFSWPTTEGTRPPGSGLVEPYVLLLMESAHLDPSVMRRAIRAFHLLESPNSLFGPSMIGAVIASTFRRRERLFQMPLGARGTLPPAL